MGYLKLLIKLLIVTEIRLKPNDVRNEICQNWNQPPTNCMNTEKRGAEKVPEKEPEQMRGELIFLVSHLSLCVVDTHWLTVVGQ